MQTFLKYLVPCLLIFSNIVSANELPWHQYEQPESCVIGVFNVLKHQYTFSTEFELEWQGVQFARALKSNFKFRTNYDVYDNEGEFACTGVGNWFQGYGLGWIYSWAADFSVYDKQGILIGSFKGSLYTEAVAKFTFYDAQKKRIGVAYMDKERKTFSLHSPQNLTRKLIEVNRQIEPYQIDYWTTYVYENGRIPPELVQVFTIFACDRQDDFLVH